MNLCNKFEALGEGSLHLKNVVGISFGIFSLCLAPSSQKKRSVIPCNPMDISLATAISRGRSGCTSNMQSLNLFIQTTLFDTFNQTRVAGRSIRKVFKTAILSALLKLNV